jgi:colanic acid/amylovoran biosynthesis glycosyltransferase
MNQSPTMIIDCPERDLSDGVSDAPAALLTDCKVAYLMSRFPKLTETFVLYEMLAVEQLGAQIEIFPMLGGFSSGKEVAGVGLFRKLKDYLSAPPRPGVMHAEAADYVSRARYMPFVNTKILIANLKTFVQQPICYLGTIAQIIRWNLGNANFLYGGLAIFLKCVYYARQIQHEGIDHIHAHFANHPAMAAYVIHRFTKITYSFTAHGSDLHRFKHMLREKVHHAAFVVTISSYNRDVIVDHCGQQYANKIHTIHCGVDLEKFQPRLTSETQSKPFQIICVGTLHEVKGQAFLIQALSKLRRQGVEAHLHLVGDGVDLAMLQELVCQESLESHVTFHGTKTRDELVQLLQDADVLAAPSVPTNDGRREGIPVVLMESMACGLPVVASRLSGIPELVNSESVGLLVPPKDTTGLAEAFAKLAKDSELRKRMGEQARQRVADDFALHRNAAQLVGLFEKSSRETNNA